ncbi:MAG: non-hydrolyzing UDP-N-acetylglucosamine 2-epimerase [Thiohalomonadaceae bacterium]
MKILHVVGARPNFMKVAPVMAAFSRRAQRLPITQRLVHTGQHYDRRMSELFFEELGLPRPDINLDVGSASHGAQTGRIMEKFEAVLLDERPDLVMVVGDVNSTLACAVDAKKMGIPVAHVEAGLRSGDIAMPEEINRIVTDAISDLLFTTERSAAHNCHGGEVHFVGNVMIDTLLAHRERALARPTLHELELMEGDTPRPYAVLTLHRPSNVETRAMLAGLGEAIADVGRRMPVIFPVHPRTQARIAGFGLDGLFSAENGYRCIEPLGYLDFLNLMANARAVLTDSGGVQEETTILGVPCLTLRDNTERPATVEQGTNRLVGASPAQVRAGIRAFLDERGHRPARVPELWDGHAADRIADVVIDWWRGRIGESPQMNANERK